MIPVPEAKYGPRIRTTWAFLLRLAPGNKVWPVAEWHGSRIALANGNAQLQNLDIQWLFTFDV